MAVNSVTIIGNLGGDPQTRSLPSGESEADFSLATTERFKGRNGERQERTESLWNDRLRFAVIVDYAADRIKSRSAELHTKEPVDEEQTTIRRVGCTCG
jgi:single-strand DNA-binding protein